MQLNGGGLGSLGFSPRTARYFRLRGRSIFGLRAGCLVWVHGPVLSKAWRLDIAVLRLVASQHIVNRFEQNSCICRYTLTFVWFCFDVFLFVFFSFFYIHWFRLINSFIIEIAWGRTKIIAALELGFFLGITTKSKKFGEKLFGLTKTLNGPQTAADPLPKLPSLGANLKLSLSSLSPYLPACSQPIRHPSVIALLTSVSFPLKIVSSNIFSIIMMKLSQPQFGKLV